MMLRIIKNCRVWLSRKLNLIAFLAAVNLALRQQLIVLRRNQHRPKLKERERLFRLFRVVMSRTWSGWRDALLVVQPDTVIRWHKKAFKLYWRRQSRADRVWTAAPTQTETAISDLANLHQDRSGHAHMYTWSITK